MVTILIFLIILSLLVIVHEFGHFVMAKRFGIKVYEFGMGFPPRAFGIYKDPQTKKWRWILGKGKSSLKETIGGDERREEFDSTLYSFNWLPLGGFVKIKGENGESAGDSDSFGHHKAWKRLVVLVAGVTMNILLAAVLLSIGFMIGLPTDISAGVPQGATVREQPSVIVQQVLDGSAAKQAGITFGDKIVAVNDEAIDNAAELTAYVLNHATEELMVRIVRGDEERVVRVTPTILGEDDETPKLGILLAEAALVRFPWYSAIYRGFVGAGIGFLNIFIAFYILIKNLILGQGLAFEVSGPVGIASVVGQSARLGFHYLLHITAMISLSLAAINILPIPALDGGRALFVVVAKIIRRPVPMRYEQLAHTIGFVLLMILIVMVTYRDIVGLVK